MHAVSHNQQLKQPVLQASFMMNSDVICHYWEIGSLLLLLLVITYEMYLKVHQSCAYNNRDFNTFIGALEIPPPTL